MADDDGWETVPKKKPVKKKKTTTALQDDLLPWVQYIPPTTQNSQFQPFVLLLCGIPGSGKSTMAKSLQQAMPYKFFRVNQDDLGNRQRCEAQARAALANGTCPVIDRCNFNPQQRSTWVGIAAEFGVQADCIVLGSQLATVDECIQRCQKRKNHPTVKSVEARGVVLAIAQQMKPPTDKEGIRLVKYVENPNVFNDTIVEYLNQA